jgi:hypothetical protein
MSSASGLRLFTLLVIGTLAEGLNAQNAGAAGGASTRAAPSQSLELQAARSARHVCGGPHSRSPTARRRSNPEVATWCEREETRRRPSGPDQCRSRRCSADELGTCKQSISQRRRFERSCCPAASARAAGWGCQPALCTRSCSGGRSGTRAPRTRPGTRTAPAQYPNTTRLGCQGGCGRERGSFRSRTVDVGCESDHDTPMQKLRIVILIRVWHGATENGP